MLKIGIVGLPNVGKSTLFNALLKKQVALAANYPFATIEPNVGVIEVPDERLAKIAEIVGTTKLVPAAIEFFDIAGLVEGASKGEGLGNQFLSHIRETAAIVHVTRLFDDSDIIHVANRIDPTSDIQIIESELIFADLGTLEKQREPKGAASKEEKATWEVIQLLKTELNKGISARNIDLSDEQKASIAHLQLISMKPVIYAFNISEDQLADMPTTEEKMKATIDAISSASSATINTDSYLAFSAKLEQEIVALEPQDQLEYLQQYGLQESGLNRLIKKAYETLGLISFLTGGVMEARAWTIHKGDTAVIASGAIHTDFMTKFIKAEIVAYDDFIRLGGWTKAREAGVAKLTGKEYVMQDGDVVEFKIGA